MPQTIEEVLAELESVKTDLRAANAESAGRRRKLADLEQSIADNPKKVGDLEAQVLTLQGTLKTNKIEAAVLLKAAELGFQNPKDAFALIDRAKVEITETGEIKGHDTELDALLKSGRLPVKGISTQKQVLGSPKIAGGNVQTQTPVEPAQPKIHL